MIEPRAPNTVVAGDADLPSEGAAAARCLPTDPFLVFAYRVLRRELEALAAILRDFLRRLRGLLGDPPYNLVLHTAPSPHPRPSHPEYWSTIEQDFHWHLEIVPRVTRIAGFEWGSGYTVNPTPPEEAALYLKQASAEHDP